jgi:selenophosphate synthase
MKFWERVERYKSMGMDPLRWVAGCAVKVDLIKVVYPALKLIQPELSKSGIKINPREDADIFPGYVTEAERMVIPDLSQPSVNFHTRERDKPSRAISLVQVHQKNAESAERFAEILLKVYREISKARVNFNVGKGHSIITSYQDAEFALFDFIRHEGDGLYTLANNDTIQIIDPTADPCSREQVYVAISNTINDLVTLGCYEKIEIYPTYDAPTEELVKETWRGLRSFASEYGVKLHEMEPVGKGKLLMGATVLGRMKKEPPVFYNCVDKEMRILVTRPIGDLAPINVYLVCCADEEYESKLQESGLDMEDVRKAKDGVIKIMAKPNLKVGKVINKYCPEVGEEYRRGEHIACTGDLSGPGLFIFKELAELAKVDMKLEEIPLSNREYVYFASREYLMENGTAGTNGAIAIIADRNVIENVYDDLMKYGYSPRIIGDVIGKGNGEVYVSPDVKNMISSGSILSQFKYD